jgi:hypothetical protein
MISHQIQRLANMLRARPDLAPAIADRLAELAEHAAAVEQEAIPPHLRQPVPHGDDVISLEAHRKRRA